MEPTNTNTNAQTSSKLSRYFPHNADTTHDKRFRKLRLKHGPAGFGMYWLIMEELRLSPNYTLDTDYEMLRLPFPECDIDFIKSVVEDFDLFEVNKDTNEFHSPMLTCAMQAMEDLHKKFSDAGKKGGQKKKELKKMTQP